MVIGIELDVLSKFYGLGLIACVLNMQLRFSFSCSVSLGR